MVEEPFFEKGLEPMPPIVPRECLCTSSVVLLRLACLFLSRLCSRILPWNQNTQVIAQYRRVPFISMFQSKKNPPPFSWLNRWETEIDRCRDPPKTQTTYDTLGSWALSSLLDNTTSIRPTLEKTTVPVQLTCSKRHCSGILVLRNGDNRKELQLLSEASQS